MASVSRVLGFRMVLLEIHTCCIHYRPSTRMIRSIYDSRVLSCRAHCVFVHCEHVSSFLINHTHRMALGHRPYSNAGQASEHCRSLLIKCYIKPHSAWCVRFSFASPEGVGRSDGSPPGQEASVPHLNLPELEPQKHVLSVFEHLSSLLIKPTHLMAIVVTNCHNHFPSQREDLIV